MIVYHGSNVVVEKPILIEATRTLDFGYGFYTTTSKNQAIKWARIKQKRELTLKGIVNIYDVSDEIFDNKTIDIRTFRGASKSWLTFVVQNRMKQGYTHGFDIVKGCVANDRVYACLNAFENKFMDFETAIKELKTYKLEDQISFNTEKALNYLTFTGYEEV